MPLHTRMPRLQCLLLTLEDMAAFNARAHVRPFPSPLAKELFLNACNLIMLAGFLAVPPDPDP